MPLARASHLFRYGTKNDPIPSSQITVESPAPPTCLRVRSATPGSIRHQRWHRASTCRRLSAPRFDAYSFRSSSDAVFRCPTLQPSRRPSRCQYSRGCGARVMVLRAAIWFVGEGHGADTGQSAGTGEEGRHGGLPLPVPGLGAGPRGHPGPGCSRCVNRIPAVSPHRHAKHSQQLEYEHWPEKEKVQ